MASTSLINQVSKDILKKMYQEVKHGHILHYKDGDLSNDEGSNLGYISIEDFFNDRKYLESTDWKWGLRKDEIEFVIEYWEYFQLLIKKK